jgi:hypothetical protein
MNRGAPSADAWASTGSGRERKMRGAERVGRPGKKEAWVEPEGIVPFLFIQMNFKLTQIVLIKR